MKKILNIIVCAFLFVVLAAPVATFAVSNNTVSINQTIRQTLISTLQTRIAELKAQIDSLTVQLEILQSQSQEETVDIKGTIKILNQLKLGSRGDDVKNLQELLATDPNIYPSKLITGYYGKLTENAVKKLQNKFCLPENGSVGPQTLWRINELLTEGAGNSGKIPSGLLTAPGIQKKLCGTTTTPDTTAPIISGLDETSITTTTTKITWTTNEVADSKIWFGTTTPVVTTGTPNITSATDVTSHEIQLTGLAVNTTYYYIVESTDTSNNSTKSTEGSFVTLIIDTTAPVISNIDKKDITTTATKITWTTNEAADSKIWFGTTTPVVTTGTPNATLSAFVTSHEIPLIGLTPSTTYYFVVGSIDSSGNIAKSSEGLFTTLTPDTTAPIISSLDETNITAIGAKITWITNEAADSKIWYSTTASVNTTGTPNITLSASVTSHEINLTGLTASTTYYYIVESTDSSSNSIKSAEGSFVTTAQ